MKLTAEERAARRDSFRRMNAAEKAEYIFAYYKLPIILLALLLYVLSYGTYRAVNRKEVLLYVGFCNVAVGDDLGKILTEEFVADTGRSPRKQEVCVYADLYLSKDPAPENREYAYASRLKVQGAIHAKQLDIVLMNREAYDLLSEIGYLMELTPAVLPADAEIQGLLTENKVVLEDNELALLLGEEEEYRENAVYQVNGINLSRTPLMQGANLTDTVFLGVMPNSPRLDAVTEYLAWLLPQGQ